MKFSDSYKWYSTCQHRWKKSKPLDMMMSYIRTFVTSLVISSIVYHWDHTLVHWGIIDITIICHNCFNITTDDILGHCSLLCCMSDHLRWHSLLHHNYVLHILMFSDVIHPLICQSCCDVIAPSQCCHTLQCFCDVIVHHKNIDVTHWYFVALSIAISYIGTVVSSL